MKKILYEGSSVKEPYQRSQFYGIMVGLGADTTVGGAMFDNTQIYHLRDVTVVWKYTGISDGAVPLPTCVVELLGDEAKLGEVERIILARQEGLFPRAPAFSGLGLQG